MLKAPHSNHSENVQDKTNHFFPFHKKPIKFPVQDNGPKGHKKLKIAASLDVGRLILFPSLSLGGRFVNSYKQKKYPRAYIVNNIVIMYCLLMLFSILQSTPPIRLESEAHDHIRTMSSYCQILVLKKSPL